MIATGVLNVGESNPRRRDETVFVKSFGKFVSWVVA
jgi:hypothetical protein